MFSYADIINKAWQLTKRYRLFWLYGMFLLGSFNVNFFHSRRWLPRALPTELRLLSIFWYFQQHPARLAVVGVSVLLFAALGLLLANLARVMLLVAAKSVLDKNPLEFSAAAKTSRRFLWPVIQISLLTSLFMLGAAAVLASPVVVDQPMAQNALWLVGLMIFLPLLFTISALNTFGAMFIVLQNLSLKKALNAATDFFVANWTKLLGLVAVLLVFYLAVFALGLGVLKLIELIINRVFLQFSAAFSIIKALGVILFWILLGILNAFVNLALLLFFLETIRPVKAEQAKPIPEAAPAPAMS